MPKQSKSSFPKHSQSLQVTVFEEFVIKGMSYAAIGAKHGFGAGRAKTYVNAAYIFLWQQYKDSVLFPQPEGYVAGYVETECHKHHVRGGRVMEPAFFPGNRDVDAIHLRPDWPYTAEGMREYKEYYAHVLHLYKLDHK